MFGRSVYGTVGSLVVITNSPARRPLRYGTAPARPGFQGWAAGALSSANKASQGGGRQCGAGEHQRQQARQRPAAWEPALEAATSQAATTPDAEADPHQQDDLTRLQNGACERIAKPEPPTLLRTTAASGQVSRPSAKRLSQHRQGQHAQAIRPRPPGDVPPP